MHTLHWIFAAARGFLPLWRAGATLHRSGQSSYCGGFSCCRAQAVGTWTSVVVAWAQYLWHMGLAAPRLEESSRTGD